jgi:hypothetical protein
MSSSFDVGATWKHPERDTATNLQVFIPRALTKHSRSKFVLAMFCLVLLVRRSLKSKADWLKFLLVRSIKITEAAVEITDSGCGMDEQEIKSW